MAWSFLSWLTVARSLQLTGALVNAILNGAAVLHLYKDNLGTSLGMIIFEVLTVPIIIYSFIAVLVQRRQKSPERSTVFSVFIVFDILFSGITLGCITVLSGRGLPETCNGFNDDGLMTLGNNRPAFNSNAYPGLNFPYEFLCHFERACYALTIGLIFSFMATIVFGTLCIFERRYTRNKRVNEMLDALERAADDKASEPAPSPIELHPRTAMAPPSEGIITRTASLRSNITAITASTASHSHGPYSRSSMISRRPVPPPIPRLYQTVNSQQPLATTGPGFMPVPLEEEDDSSADAALVADGIRHHQNQHQQRPQQLQQQIQQQQQQRLLPQKLQAEQQHQQQQSSSSSSQQYQPPQTTTGMPIVTEEDQHALVSDGMRPNEPTLPPYEPSRTGMPGHSGETNGMILSGYVKGGDRAQDMKDSGGY